MPSVIDDRRTYPAIRQVPALMDSSSITEIRMPGVLSPPLWHLRFDIPAYQIFQIGTWFHDLARCALQPCPDTWLAWAKTINARTAFPVATRPLPRVPVGAEHHYIITIRDGDSPELRVRYRPDTGRDLLDWIDHGTYVGVEAILVAGVTELQQWRAQVRGVAAKYGYVYGRTADEITDMVNSHRDRLAVWRELYATDPAPGSGLAHVARSEYVAEQTISDYLQTRSNHYRELAQTTTIAADRHVRRGEAEQAATAAATAQLCGREYQRARAALELPALAEFGAMPAALTSTTDEPVVAVTAAIQACGPSTWPASGLVDLARNFSIDAAEGLDL